MKDNLSPPNLGTAPREYDYSFFHRAIRGIEILLADLLSKGPIRVSSIEADSLTVAEDVTVAGDVAVTGNVVATGDVTATKFHGDGSELTNLPPADLSNLNASNLTSGTVPDARFPATLPAVSGANLTNVNAALLNGAIAQSGALDTTSGRLLTVGAFGLGSQVVSSATDLNTYQTAGFYIIPNTGVTNLPAGWPQARHVLEVSGGVSYSSQTIQRPDGLKASRFATGTTYTDWSLQGFGLGNDGQATNALLLPSNDCNQAIISGVYSGSGAATVNGPPNNGGYGSMFVSRRGNNINQIMGFGNATDATTVLFMRTTIDGGSNWTSWLPLIPTYGSNINGEYVRFADGTQICWQVVTTTGMAINAAYGSLFQGTLAWTYPAAFIARPAVQCSEFRWGTSASWGCIGGVPSTTGAVLRGIDVSSRAVGTSSNLSAMAIGRWY